MLFVLLLSCACQTQQVGPPAPVAVDVYTTPLLDAAAHHLADAFGRDHQDTVIRVHVEPAATLALHVHNNMPAQVVLLEDQAAVVVVRGHDAIFQPQPFAKNPLVVATAKDSTLTLEQLTAPGTRLALGSNATASGRLARDVLSTLQWRDAVLKNVAETNDSDALVVAQLASGKADAAFVFASDAAQRGWRVLSLPTPVMSMATVARTRQLAPPEKQTRADAFVAFVRSEHGFAGLVALGFLPPNTPTTSTSP